MSEQNMKTDISLNVNTKGEDLIDRLARKVRKLQSDLKAVNADMVRTAKAASSPSGSKPSHATKASQGKGASTSADKRAASDLYTFRARLEAQRQREAARNEAYLHRLRQSSYRQAERDNAKALRDRVAGEARIAREAKAAQAATVRAASAELRSIRERVAFATRMTAQKARAEATIVRDQRQASREEAQALRARMNFVARMANQRAREESASERDRQAAMRESIRLDRYRMSLRDREERRLHRESTARDSERDRLRGSALSNARSAVHHGSEGFSRTTRTIAGVGAVAAGAGALATRAGIGARMETDTAETNLSIFSEQSQEQIRAARRGWLDREAIRNGLNVAGGLNAYNEVLKTGMKSPVENTKSIIGAVSALELDLRDTTKLAGLIDRNYGANSSPAKIKSALNAIAVAAREDPTQAPEIVEGMKRGFGALSMGNMKPEELAALVSGGQSVGIQPGKAGTFIATLGKQLSSGANRFLDPKNRKELNFAASAMGFGNSREMARQFREDSTGTIMKVLESMKAMDPTKRTTVASALSGNQWNDEDLQIVNGLDGLKNTLAAVRDPSNAGFVDDAARKRQTSWLGQWNSTKAIFNRFWESFGAGFDEILVAINSYFLDLHGRFDFDKITDIVKQGLEGVKEALGVKTWRDLLSGMFGGSLASVGQEVRSFARGFTAGIMEIVNGIRSLMTAFSGTGVSAETLGKLTGQLITLSAACLIAAPVVTVLSGLALGITALIKGALAAWAMLKSVGLVGAASSAATAGIWATAGGVIATAFLAKVANSLGILKPPDMSKGWTRGALEFLDPGLARLILGDEKSETKDKPSASRGASDSWDAPIVSPNDNIHKPTEDLRKAIEDNTLIHKQSFESNDNFAGLIRKASFTTGDSGRAIRASIQGQASDLRSAVTSGSTGVVGGGPLSASRPGSALGNVGIGGRGIIGGGQTSPGFNAGSGTGADAASSGPAVPGDKRMGGSRSWRNNNPGNIEYGPFARSMGATGTDGRFAVFPDYKSGRNAQEKLLFEGQNYKNLTLAQAIRRWAPASENNVPAYIAAMKADPSTRMRDFTPDQRSTLLDAMQRHEGWKVGRTVPGATQPVGGANGAVMGGTVDSANRLVGVASQYVGMGENNGGRGTLEQFMGGGSIVGEANAWCARFVNASLKAVGDSGTGSNIANSFLKWGKSVEAEAVKAGDIAVEHRGRGVDGRGGHVGIATGKTRYGRNGQLQVETIEGNSSNMVKRDWTDANKLAIRRSNNPATQVAEQVAAETKDNAQSLKELGKSNVERGGPGAPNIDALKSLKGAGINLPDVRKFPRYQDYRELMNRERINKAFGGQNGAINALRGRVYDPLSYHGDGKASADMLVNPKWNAAGASDAGSMGQNVGTKAPLGAEAPISPVKSGQGGSSQTSVQAPITIHGAGQNADQIANAVQRKLQESMNRRTHDLDPSSMTSIG